MTVLLKSLLHTKIIKLYFFQNQTRTRKVESSFEIRDQDQKKTRSSDANPSKFFIFRFKLVWNRSRSRSNPNDTISTRFWIHWQMTKLWSTSSRTISRLKIEIGHFTKDDPCPCYLEFR